MAVVVPGTIPSLPAASDLGDADLVLVYQPGQAPSTRAARVSDFQLASFPSQSAAQVFASPAGASGVPSFRPLQSTDLTPALSLAGVTSTGGTADRALQDRFAERVNVRDQGAVGDGVTDDSEAFIKAINRCNTINATGVRVVLYIPAGVYLIKGTNGAFPTFARNASVIGHGPQLSWIALDSSYSGDVFSWSECWMQSNYGSTSVTIATQAAGPTVQNITISGNRGASQNAFVFYDRNDFVLFRDVNIFNIKGYGLSFGQTKNQAQAYLRESTFHNVRLFSCGDTGKPAWDFNATGSGAGATGGSEVDASDIEIYSPYGTGMAIRNGSSGNLRDYRITHLRIEGLETGGVSADLLQVGDTGLNGQVNTIMFDQLQLISPYTGFAGMRVTSSASGVKPFGISVYQGWIGIGAGGGKGLVLDAGHDSQYHFTGISTSDTQVTVGPSTMVGANNLIDGGGEESLWTYSIDATSYGQIIFPLRSTGLPTNSTNVSQMILRGTTSGSSAIRLTADGAAAGASNTVNMVTGTSRHLIIRLVAQDVTTRTKSYSYYNDALITMGFAAGSTTVTVGTAAEHSNGTPGTISTSATADTTLGALNLSWTPPSANTDTWDVTALVQWVKAS